MNFTQTFLKLTEYTIPYGQEPILEKYLPKRHIKDGCGNYYFRIGKKSRTVFTCHMDTASYNMRKVTHRINGKYIQTDGRTILGGDDKNGMTILLYMIQQGVPGTYYFFAGEESGMAGAKKIINSNKEFFSNYDRMVSFDRRDYSSVITHQMGQRGCSPEFGNSLADQLNLNGMNYRLDSTGIYTDSASFIGIIPNVTNLSCGYWGEHSNSETTDIEFVEKLAKAACKVKWEELDKTEPVFGYSYYNDEDFWW